jgi:hypothetical protein
MLLVAFEYTPSPPNTVTPAQAGAGLWQKQNAERKGRFPREHIAGMTGPM